MRHTVLGVDPRYPMQLRDLRDPPGSLTVVGSLPSLDRAVAVVGTRAADAEALGFSRQLSADLTRLGCVVVSGGARGIDAAAHEGALAAGGATIAVLATGTGVPYPPCHRDLFARIAGTGALVSELDADVPPRPSRFLARNRIIAALARAVVVIQAPARSGALSTARWARTLDRPLLTVPASPWDPRGAGCLALLRSGARVCASARDVVEALGDPDARHVAPYDIARAHSADIPKALAEPLRQVLSLLERPRHPDALIHATDRPPAEVQQILLDLTLTGLVHRMPDGRYQRRTH